jgi:hypothetical protein
MFIALDKLANQGLKQVIVVVPVRSIGGSFQDEPLSKFGFFADWKVEFKKEKGRLPSLTSPDAWEKRMAEGVAFLQREAMNQKNG